MDAARFDRLTRWLATHRLSRRAAVRASAVALAGLTSGSRALAAAPATPPSPAPAGGMAANNATYFVQTATGGTFRPNPQAGTPVAGSPRGATHGTYLLTLTGHNGETVTFSDRPARTFGEVDTSQFFKSMGFLAANPPNAALVADLAGQPDEVVLVELLSPHYDASSQTLTYEANLLHQYPNARGSALAPIATKAQTAPPAGTFGAASLFIDDCPDINTCYTLGLVPAGSVPGAPIGTCWNAWQLLCLPCNGNSIQFYEQLCNQTYPNQCSGSCVVYTA